LSKERASPTLCNRILITEVIAWRDTRAAVSSGQKHRHERAAPLTVADADANGSTMSDRNADSNDFREYGLTTQFNSPEFGTCVVVDTIQNRLHQYLQHAEEKSLAPTGGPCRYNTRGLLQRPHIIAGKFRRIGKDTDRRWEEGDDLDSMRFRPIEYERDLPKRTRYATATANKAFARQVRDIGIRELMRFGCGRRTLQRISRRQSRSPAFLCIPDLAFGNIGCVYNGVRHRE
jgi:hypothetical protein